MQILKNSNDASGYHYYIGQKNNFFSIEQSQDEIDIKPIKKLNYHTNHYIHNKFKKRSKHSKNSLIRFNRMTTLLKQKVPFLNILFDKKGRPDSIFSREGDTNRTLATVVFRPQKKKVYIYDHDSPTSFKQYSL